MNKNIVGGWKYINKDTGIFFNNENDFEEKLLILIKNFDNYKPRKYFLDNYGLENSSYRLRKFINSISDQIIDSKKAILHCCR